MKKFILIFAMAISMSIVFGQTATLRLEMPATPPAVGENFFVGVYLDVLEWPADPTIWSAIFGFNYDPAVLTAVSTGIPFNRWYHNQNQMFIDYGALPQSNVPTPGDLRIFFATGAAYGFDPSLYEFESGVTPFKFFDLRFTYLGGDIEITWQNDTPKLEPAPGGVSGGTLKSVETEMYAPPPPAVGVPYVLTTIGIIPGGPTFISWNGSVSSDWFDGNNWDGGVYPGVFDDAVIPNGMPNYPQVLNNAEVAVCNNLTVEDAALVIVGEDGYMTVVGTLDNAGFFGTISDAVASGSLICADIQGTGVYNYWRWLEITGDDMAEETGWHYMSSPTAGFGSYNVADYYVNTWNEPTSLWIQHDSPDPSIPCNPAPEIFMSGMEGWSLKFEPMYSSLGCPLPGAGGQMVIFDGPYNTGDQSSVITNNGVGLYPGFNMVGNPYPSYWDYDAFYFGPNWPGAALNDAIYYWDESAQVYASYVFGVPNNGGTNWVPPAQAFFFEAIDAAVPLTFTQAEQVHVVGLPYWKEEATDVVRLEVSANGYTDQTTVVFNEDATIDRDKIDARKLFNGSSVPNIYTMGGDVELSINQLPATLTVPVYFTCNASGTYTISAVETSEFQYVVLEDLTNGIQTDLLTGDYTFAYTQGEDADRFMLHFTPLGTPELEANSIRIWSNDHKIYVSAPEVSDGSIVVFNMMGQEVTSKDVDPGLNILPVSDVNTYYVVKVLTANNAKTGKVFVK